ncbi:Transcriptional regulator, XRE family [Rhodospirillaceae bacterium LM-1]|nr:Transcriptional regulator, XRE family [Rhodospirillaceae bacterium LM-1]
MREAVAWAKGEDIEARSVKVKVPTSVDVGAVRHKLGLTQSQFADAFGFTVSSVRNWEQGHRAPEGAARVLLTVIARKPRAVLDALREEGLLERA